MLFLVSIFIIKKSSVFKNTETYERVQDENGLIYSNATIEDLVNKDNDQDGIPDWEEGLYGLDPGKKETTPGTPDIVAINRLSAENTLSPSQRETGSSAEKLTETDKFSRELFATIVTLNQNGQIDEAAIDKLSTSLSEQIQNSVQRKIYTISDIKIINDDTKQAVQKYSDALNNIYIKYKTNKGVIEILEEFLANEENTSILSKLEPVIAQTNKIISESIKIPAPRSLSVLHLNLINSSEQVAENVSDIRLLDSDIVVAIGAISQYEKNATALASAADRLIETIKQKLNN